MQTIRPSLILAGLLSITCVSAALAYVYPGRPNCPWASPSNSWAKFLNQEYGDKQPYFSIRFTRNIGGIVGGQCYTVFYAGRGNWGGDANKVDKRGNAEIINGGDPAKYEFNVGGARFTYNEGGEVFYVRDGKLAGTMYCRIGSQCWL